MSLVSRVSDLAVAIATDIKTLRTQLTGSSTGDLTGLTTTAKTSIVAAINEVKAAATGAPPSASATAQGVIEIATNAEALAMSDTTRALVPSNLAGITNVANGLVKLDGTGKVAAAQLPSFVDDVLEFTNLAGFPVTGETGKIYVALDTNKTYRWGGSAYAEISASPGSTDAVTEGSSNLYFTTSRANTAADARITALVGATETDLAAAYAAAKA